MIKATCIKCGDEDATVAVYTHDGTIQCQGCDAEYTVEDVENVLAEWTKILPWIKSHPCNQEKKS